MVKCERVSRLVREDTFGQDIFKTTQSAVGSHVQVGGRNILGGTKSSGWEYAVACIQRTARRPEGLKVDGSGKTGESWPDSGR